MQFASQISGMRFCEASAKDNFNVDEIFLKLVDDILSKVEPDMLKKCWKRNFWVVVTLVCVKSQYMPIILSDWFIASDIGASACEAFLSAKA